MRGEMGHLYLTKNGNFFIVDKNSIINDCISLAGPYIVEKDTYSFKMYSKFGQITTALVALCPGFN